MPPLSIRVLGPFEARCADGPLLTFESLKVQALLAYLAVESARAHGRAAVATLLWPDRPEAAALGNLRHTLASLRTTLSGLEASGEPHPPFLHVSPKTVQFNAASTAQVDLWDFERHLAAAVRSPGADLAGPIPQWRAAVALNRGRFMEGFALRGCPEYEGWMLLCRENLALKLQAALHNLADAETAVGAWEEALASLRRLLEIEPWEETAHRKLMALLAAHDQRGAAIKQYERCRALLRDELGVEPAEETRRLHEQIKAGKGPEAEPAPKPSPTARPIPRGRRGQVVPTARAHFAGRAAELERLHRALALALDEQGQVVFIAGEAGSGKTSLAWEFARQALNQEGDLLVVAGRCNAITGLEDPFLPFREIVQVLVGGKQPHLSGNLGPEHRRGLTEAFPDIVRALLTAGPELIGSFIHANTLRQRIETFGPGGSNWLRALKQIAGVSAPSLLSGSDPGRGPHEPITRFFAELAMHRPLLVFLDDLQWADADSISLLHYLCTRLAGSPILVLGAYRPQDVALGQREPAGGWRRHPFDAVRLELQRVFGDMEVDLDRAAGEAFVAALTDLEPNSLGEPFRQTLYQKTNGNTLFTLELLRSMKQRGDLVPDTLGRWTEGECVDWEALPPRVEAVIAERIGRISPAQQRLLRTASVEGESFTVEVVARVLGLDEAAVMDWLGGPLSREQELVVAQGAALVGDNRLLRYRFSHALFQVYLYNSLNPAERAALHGDTGKALETLYGAAVPEIALSLARHYEQAGQMALAGEYLLVAGRQAITLGAHWQAKALFERALALVRRLAPSPERIQLEIQAELAQSAPALFTDGWGSRAAAQATSRAIELCERSGEEGPESALLLALYFQADQLCAQNDITAAQARVDLLLRRATGADRVFRTMAAAMAGQVYLLAGELRLGAEYLDQALALYHLDDRVRYVELIGYDVVNVCHAWFPWADWLLGFPGRARARSETAIDAARQQPHPFVLANTLAVAGALLSALQDEPDPAYRCAQECLPIAAAENVRLAVALSQIVAGWAEVKRGDSVGGIAHLRGGLDDWETGGALTMLPFGQMLLADALSLAGQAEGALAVVASLIDALPQMGRRALEAHLYWLKGEILVRAGAQADPHAVSEDSATIWFERAIDVARQQGARSLELRAMTSLASCWQDAGMARQAFQRLEPIYLSFAGEPETSDLRKARTILAQLAQSL